MACSNSSEVYYQFARIKHEFQLRSNKNLKDNLHLRHLLDQPLMSETIAIDEKEERKSAV